MAPLTAEDISEFIELENCPQSLKKEVTALI